MQPANGPLGNGHVRKTEASAENSFARERGSERQRGFKRCITSYSKRKNLERRMCWGWHFDSSMLEKRHGAAGLRQIIHDGLTSCQLFPSRGNSFSFVKKARPHRHSHQPQMFLPCLQVLSLAIHNWPKAWRIFCLLSFHLQHSLGRKILSRK